MAKTVMEAIAIDLRHQSTARCSDGMVTPDSAIGFGTSSELEAMILAEAVPDSFEYSAVTPLAMMWSYEMLSLDLGHG